MCTKSLLLISSCVALLSVPVSAYCQTENGTEEQQNKKEKESLPLWEVGVAGFGLSQQAYPGSDVHVSRVLVLPYFLYRGEAFRVDREGTGYRAVKTPTFEFDVGFAGAFGSKSDKVTTRAGMANLGTMIEFGPRLKWNISPVDSNGKWRFELPVRGVFDVSNGFKYRGATVEPEISFERRANAGWNYGSAVSMVFGNQPLAATFYQVNPNEVLVNRPQYNAQSGLILWRMTHSVSHKFGNDWRVFGGVRIDSVQGAKNQDSPLVKKKTAASFFMGINYTIHRSQQFARD
jgi:outer membrane protein